jgi:cyclopropane fatty-acyl-phospholipid synthase-like methyltransferase
MLVQARKNIAHLGSDVLLQRADYRNLSQDFEGSFDAVTCLGSIGYMLDGKQFLRSFRSMNAVLGEGGTQVMATIPTDKQWKEKPRFSLNVNTFDITRLFVMNYFERTVRYNILDTFHRPHPRFLLGAGAAAAERRTQSGQRRRGVQEVWKAATTVAGLSSG